MRVNKTVKSRWTVDKFQDSLIDKLEDAYHAECVKNADRVLEYIKEKGVTNVGEISRNFQDIRAMLHTILVYLRYLKRIEYFDHSPYPTKVTFLR